VKTNILSDYYAFGSKKWVKIDKNEQKLHGFERKLTGICKKLLKIYKKSKK